jgi:hypothetical protein
MAGTIFTNGLKTNLQMFVPGLPPSLADELRLSVTLVKDLPPNIHDLVVSSYIQSIRPTFWLGTAASILCIFFTLWVVNLSFLLNISHMILIILSLIKKHNIKQRANNQWTKHQWFQHYLLFLMESVTRNYYRSAGWITGRLFYQTSHRIHLTTLETVHDDCCR